MSKRIISAFCVVIVLLSLVVLPAGAATYSYDTSTQSFIVETKANWWYPGSESVSISASKGTFSYSETSWFGKKTGKTKTKKEYGTWKISVSSLDGSHSFSKTMKGSSIKLNLKPNKTYRVTVSYDGTQDTFRQLNYRDFRWNNYPSWKVSGTWKVSSCH